MKKGRFLNVLKNHPVNSALSITRHSVPYAELGIRDIFIPRGGDRLFPDLPARDAELIEQFQLPPELGAGDFAAQQPAVLAERPRHLLRGFVEEFHAEMPHAQLHHPRDILRAGLGQRVEDRVAAADVRLHRMLRAHAIAQFQVVPVARAAAVPEIRAVRQKRAEHAMLHVKHRHVLVDRDFEPFRRRG